VLSGDALKSADIGVAFGGEEMDDVRFIVR